LQRFFRNKFFGLRRDQFLSWEVGIETLQCGLQAFSVSKNHCTKLNGILSIQASLRALSEKKKARAHIKLTKPRTKFQQLVASAITQTPLSADCLRTKRNPPTIGSYSSRISISSDSKTQTWRTPLKRRRQEPELFEIDGAFKGKRLRWTDLEGEGELENLKPLGQSPALDKKPGSSILKKTDHPILVKKSSHQRLRPIFGLLNQFNSRSRAANSVNKVSKTPSIPTVHRYFK
jgi:hypothetical protein